MNDAESLRLKEDGARERNWKRWGPYLSERQWGTVREDYSPDGSCWEYFPHDHSRSRAYRWGEDGLLGITDRQCRLCFALALWNERDPILKERLFGLTGPEGNHGEDVKEEYFYLDSTPTHSYMKALYKYPQQRFPYEQLVDENRKRGKKDREFELADTGVFDDGRYFDVFAEYAKALPDDILIRVTIANRGPNAAPIHVLPTLWFRNSWVWGCTHEGCEVKPRIAMNADNDCVADHSSLGKFRFAIESGYERVLFTDNQSNPERLHGDDADGYFKDAFHDYVIHDRSEAVNPKGYGTKAAPHFRFVIPAGERVSIRLRLAADGVASDKPFRDFDQVFADRIAEADSFYAAHIPGELTDDQKSVSRQAYAGMLWSKQFYHFVVDDWLKGDAHQPPPPKQRKRGRNSDWRHLYNRDVISMPDKWEYPWYAAWDLAFHMIPFARIDPDFAKRQLILFLREWYMHPNGPIPAYEFNFSDVNPPVHAWACWRVYKMAAKRGDRDREFLASAFQKLLLNFTWWVNRKDMSGKHLFGGGFLGLDNIGVFDRSQPLPTGGHLEQADGTAWMAFYCATMLSMAIELAREDVAYEDMASKFFEHFIAIADAMNTLGGDGLWDEADGFYYDQLFFPEARGGKGESSPLRVRSLVGLLPLIAVEILEEDVIEKLPGFSKRLRWFLKYREDLASNISYCNMTNIAGHEHLLLAIPSRERLESVLKYMLNESEFLSPFGIRSLSRMHKADPFVMHVNGSKHSVSYVPGESDTELFGGNSNWRGPIWFPVNYLLIESLERYHHFYGDHLKVEFPTGSGRQMTLGEVARELSKRLTLLFESNGKERPCHCGNDLFAGDPHFRDLLLFHEYFHGDTGRGLGASHQTGWTGLITRCYEKLLRR